MIAMEVREHHRVELCESRTVDLARAGAQRPGPVAQERVGEDANAVQLDQDGGVPDAREAHG